MNNQPTNFVVAINRECGTGGHTIAKLIGKKLGVNVYDRAMLDSLTEKYGLTKEKIEQIKSKRTRWWNDFQLFYRQFDTMGQAVSDAKPRVTSLQLYYAETQILRDLASKESCVVVGRSSFSVFSDHPCVTRIFITASDEYRIARMMRKRSITDKEAKRIMDDFDESRENYTRTFAKTSRYDARNYDIVFNVSDYTEEEAAQFLTDLIVYRNKKKGL